MKFKNLLAMLSVAAFIASCSNDEETTPTLSNEESAELVGDALSSEINELTVSVPSLVEYAENGRATGVQLAMACGVAYDTTVERQYEGVYQSFEFSVSYGYELDCDGFVPSELTFDYVLSGAREGLRSTTNRSSVGNFSVTGLVQGSDFLVDGTATSSSNGTLTGANDTFTLSGESSLTVSDLAIGKVSQRISSGDATFTYVGTTSEGAMVEFTSSVTFHGNEMATVTINGESFEINWSTGEIED